MNEPGPTAEELAGTIFANVEGYTANGDTVLTSEAAVGGGDG